MLRSFIKTLILLIISILFFLFYVLKFTNSISDNFYLRFTTPKQASLIIGTSRGAQGIVPEIFNVSNLNFDKKLYNFSFTNGQALFGSIYYNAISKKLKQNTLNGLYIIEVSPMSISEVKSTKNGIVKLEETNSFLEIKNVNKNPNFEYILRYYSEPYYTLLYKQIRKNQNSKLRKYIKGFQNYSAELRDDGWLEVTVPMDSTSFKERLVPHIEEHKEYLSLRHFSQYRFNYLEKTINLLQQHGHVVLVRLPIDKRLFEIEINYMPNFNDFMNQLSNKYKIPYYTFNNVYLTTDGNHLFKTDSKRISEEILKMIKLNFNN